VYWDSGDTGCCGGNMRISYGTTSDSQFEGEWNYWVFVKDGTTDFSGIYWNGQLVESTTGSTADLGPIDNMVIGENYRGMFDDIAFFDVALTAEQIQQLYDARNGQGVSSSDNSLIKAGSGTLTLAGDNTYIGITDVQEGALLINGTTSGQGNYTVAGGAALGGSGTIGLAADNSVTIAGGATLAPGDAVGALSIDGHLVLEDGALYQWELGAGVDEFDTVQFVGAAPGDLTLDTWTLVLGDAGGEPEAGDVFYLFSGFDQLLGANNWMIDGSLVPDWDTSSMSIGVDDVGVFLQAAQIPEPSSLVLAALGLLGLALYVRRRRIRA
jgi:autotransporter-associated beta strand protein